MALIFSMTSLRILSTISCQRIKSIWSIVEEDMPRTVSNCPMRSLKNTLPTRKIFVNGPLLNR